MGLWELFTTQSFKYRRNVSFQLCDLLDVELDTIRMRYTYSMADITSGLTVEAGDTNV